MTQAMRLGIQSHDGASAAKPRAPLLLTPESQPEQIHNCGNGCVYQMRKCKIWDLVKMNSPIASYALCLARHCHGDTCHIFSTGGSGRNHCQYTVSVYLSPSRVIQWRFQSSQLTLW